METLPLPKVPQPWESGSLHPKKTFLCGDSRGNKFKGLKQVHGQTGTLTRFVAPIGCRAWEVGSPCQAPPRGPGEGARHWPEPVWARPQFPCRRRGPERAGVRSRPTSAQRGPTPPPGGRARLRSLQLVPGPAKARGQVARGQRHLSALIRRRGPRAWVSTPDTSPRSPLAMWPPQASGSVFALK